MISITKDELIKLHQYLSQKNRFDPRPDYAKGYYFFFCELGDILSRYYLYTKPLDYILSEWQYDDLMVKFDGLKWYLEYKRDISINEILNEDT